MKKRGSFPALVGCILAAALIFPACSGNAGTAGSKAQVPSEGSSESSVPASSLSKEEPADPLGKYDETISLTSCRVFASFMTLDPGEDVNNNWWTKTYLDKLNIKVTQAWTAPSYGTEFDTKFNIAAASDSLPDIIPCYTTLAVKEISSGKVWDLTDVYQKYASDQVKAIFEKDPKALQCWSVDGKLMGLPTQIQGTPKRSGFWIRKDWLEKVGLDTPKNFQEVVNAMKQFVAKKPGGKPDTYGIEVDKTVSVGIGPAVSDGTGGGRWMKKDGKLMLSNTNESVKKTWQTFADWYKEGLISKNFAVDTNAELEKDWLNGKVGVFAGSPQGMAGNTGIYNWLKIYPEGDCVWVPLTTVDGKAPTYVAEASYPNVVLVNKKCKNPEAVMKLFNLGTAIFNDPKPSWITDNAYQSGKKGGWAEFWNSVCSIEDPENQLKNTELAIDAFRTGNTSKLTATARDNYYKYLVDWKEKGKSGENWWINFTYWKCFQPDGPVDKDIQRTKKNTGDWKTDAYWGPETKTYSANAQNWSSEYNKDLTQAILTGKVDEYFESYVNFVKANGGEDACREAEEWMAKNGK